MTLNVVTHNIYWGQGWPSLWGEERHDPHSAIVNGLIQLYASVHPDVLCLQEVPSYDLFSILQTRLNMRGAYAPGGIIPAYGGAILIGDQVEVFSINDTSSTFITVERVFERVCLNAQVQKRGRELSLVNIHLSSNRYVPDGCGGSIRLAEISVLLEAGSRPDIIVGDFNAVPESAVYRRMKDCGYIDAEKFCASPNGPRPDRLDYIWLSEPYLDGLVGCQVISGEAFQCVDAGRPTYLSDHYPVVARLNLERDQ